MQPHQIFHVRNGLLSRSVWFGTGLDLNIHKSLSILLFTRDAKSDQLTCQPISKQQIWSFHEPLGPYSGRVYFRCFCECSNIVNNGIGVSVISQGCLNSFARSKLLLVLVTVTFRLHPMSIRPHPRFSDWDKLVSHWELSLQTGEHVSVVMPRPSVPLPRRWTDFCLLFWEW